jgi:sugar phosphate isomerase/epimerase
MIGFSATVPLQYDTSFSPFSASEYQKGVTWVKECGFDGVEFVIAEPDKVYPDELNTIVQNAGLKVSAIATGQSYALEGISLIDEAKEIRAKAVQKICKHVDLSANLIGRPNVTVGLIRGVGNQADTKKQMRFLCETMSQCAEYAGQNDIVINFEPINRYEASLINSTSEGAEFLKAIGNPSNVGILYDTFHSNIEDKNMADAVNDYTTQICHVHFADSNRALPGEGHIDFMSIYHILVRNGYQGYISLETLNIPDREFVIKNAAKRLLNIKEQKWITRIKTEKECCGNMPS